MKLITLLVRLAIINLKLAINSVQSKRNRRKLYKTTLQIRRLDRCIRECDLHIQILEIAERN
jgi:hypothetical protein